MSTEPTIDPIVTIDNVTRRYGAVAALDGVSLTIARGEFLTLLGPSGCGKTTLLRSIAGFDEPTAGSITLAGRPMRGVPAHKRPVNMVFQRPTLFPHLDVAGNVGFGLRLARVSGAEVRRRVDEALALVRLSGYGPRRSHELSGGQQQRVALARALVNRPQVLLLDEPLSALDLRIRMEMEVELRRVHRESGTTFVYVTHDQREALALSDRVAVFNAGRVEQIGAPAEVYDRPHSPFVARFVGAANVLPVDVGDELAMIGAQVLPAWLLPDASAARTESGYSSESGVARWLVVRPQVVTLSAMADDGVDPVDSAVSTGRLTGVIKDVAFRGTGFEYEVQLPGVDGVVRAEMPLGTSPLTYGQRVAVSWPASLATTLERQP